MDEYAEAILELADYLVGRFCMAVEAAESLGLDVGDMNEAELEVALSAFGVKREGKHWAEELEGDQ